MAGWERRGRQGVQGGEGEQPARSGCPPPGVRGAGSGKGWGLGYRRGKVMITHLASGGTAGTAVAAVTSGATAAAGDEGHVGDAEVTRWGGGTAKGLEGEGG